MQKLRPDWNEPNVWDYPCADKRNQSRVKSDWMSNLLKQLTREGMRKTGDAERGELPAEGASCHGNQLRQREKLPSHRERKPHSAR